MTIPIWRKYVAPPSPKAHFKHDYSRKIVWSMQLRGVNDDLPTLIYYGAPFKLLCDVMDYVARCAGDMMEGFVVNREHSCRYKNGKAYHRVSVELHGIDTDRIHVESLAMIINHYMQRICWCTVTELPLKKLLNL